MINRLIKKPNGIQSLTKVILQGKQLFAGGFYTREKKLIWLRYHCNHEIKTWLFLLFFFCRENYCLAE